MATDLDASRRHLGSRAATVGLLMRNTVNLGVALIAIADPDTSARTTGAWLLAILAVWSLYRLLTRSRGIGWLVVDYLLVLAVCASIPVLITDPGFHTSNTAPQAIAGTAVVSISVSVAPYLSLLMTAGVAAAYAWGAAGVTGWENIASVTALYYFAVQWATASAIRYVLLRMAGVIDRARAERQRAEVNRRVVAAVRDYEYEQLALLHDTAASTLLIVGQDIPVSAERLAAQARRDLDVLENGAWATPLPEVELVASLRECATHISTPVSFSGLESIWLPGESARPVIAAAREVMTNVDRHARASVLRVVVTDALVRIEDDGVGFDAHAPQSGHGLRDSVIGRMRRGGGHARVMSAPGAGTVTELCWTATPAGSPTTSAVNDPDRLVERTRTRYALALTTYALVNLLITVPPAVTSAADPELNTLLGIVAALSTLAAVPGILYGRWHYAKPAGITLLVVAVVQPALLPAELVVGYGHWAQSTIGWCVLPLVLGRPTRTGAVILIGCWLLGSAVTLFREPSAAALVNIGLGTASILAVQLFALMFNGLMRDAVADAHLETQAHQRFLTRDRVSRAVQAEYRRRYAKVVDNVAPLLDALARGHEVDSDMQLRARTECRRLRALFDQAAAFDHPLMQEIRTLIDLAESRQVEVVVDLSGPIGDLDSDQITALVTPLAHVLQHAQNSARVVITTAGELTELSVVCDVTSDLAELQRRLANTELIVAGDEIWCLIRHSGRTATPPW